MRCLAEEETRVLSEIADGLEEKVRHRDVVGIEYDDELSIRIDESRVHVAGLGVEVLGPRVIGRPDILGELRQLGPTPPRRPRRRRVFRVALLVRPSVVEEVDLQLVGRIIDCGRGRERDGQQILVFVVSGHEDVDGGHVGFFEPRGRRALQGIRDDEEADAQHDDAVELGTPQRDPAHEVRRVGHRRQRARGPPENVADHDPGAERQEDLAP